MRKWTILAALCFLVAATTAASAGQGPKSSSMDKSADSFHVIDVSWNDGGENEFGGFNHNGSATFQLMEGGLFVWFSDNYNENGVWCGPGDDGIEGTEDDWYGDAWHSSGFEGEMSVEGELHLMGKKAADGAHAWALLFVGGDEGYCGEGGGFGERPMVVEVWMDPSDTTVRDRNATFVRSPDSSSRHTYTFNGREGSGWLNIRDVWYDGETGEWGELPEDERFYEEFTVDGRYGSAKASAMNKS